MPHRWSQTAAGSSPRISAGPCAHSEIGNNRLTFAGQIIETRTLSYRLAHARQQQNAKKAASAPTR